MRAWLLLSPAACLLAGCLPTARAVLDLPEDASSVLFSIPDQGNQRFFFAESRETFDSVGLPFNLGEGTVVIQAFPETLDELLLSEGEVAFDQEGIPLARPSHAYRLTLVEGEALIEEADELPQNDDLLLAYPRWFECVQRGRCVVSRPRDAGRFLCQECAVEPPRPPADPEPVRAPKVEDLATGCVEDATAPAASITACALPAFEICPADQADFVGGAPGCRSVTTACDASWPALPPDVVRVPDDAATLAVALSMLGPSRTIALEPGAHQGAGPLDDVHLIGRCAETVVEQSGSITDTTFANLTLAGQPPGSTGVSLDGVVLTADFAFVRDLQVRRSLIAAPIEFGGTVTVESSVFAPGSDIAIVMFGGTLTMRDARIAGNFEAATSSITIIRTASEGSIAASDSELSLTSVAIAAGARIVGLHLGRSRLVADGLTVDSGSVSGVILSASTATISRLVVRHPSFLGAWMDVSPGSTLEVHGAAFDGVPDRGVVAFGRTVLEDVVVDMGEPRAMPDQVPYAFATGALSELSIERARVTTVSGTHCVAGADAQFSISDLECTAALAGGIGVSFGPGAVVQMSRARILNFKNAVWGAQIQLDAEDLEIECADGPSGTLSGGFEVNEKPGRLSARRFAIRNCPEFAFNSGRMDEVLLEDIAVTNSYSGILLRREASELRRISIVGAEHRGILLDGFESNALLEDISITETTPDAVYAFDAIEAFMVSLTRFSIEGGDTALVFGNLAPDLDQGRIAHARVGVAVLPSLFPGAMELIDGLVLEDVGAPVEPQVDR